jgi:hypothetical protein
MIKKSAGVFPMTQLQAARKGIITEEMTFVSRREDLEPELIRSEEARLRSGPARAFGGSDSEEVDTVH